MRIEVPVFLPEGFQCRVSRHSRPDTAGSRQLPYKHWRARITPLLRVAQIHEPLSVSGIATGLVFHRGWNILRDILGLTGVLGHSPRTSRVIQGLEHVVTQPRFAVELGLAWSAARIDPLAVPSQRQPPAVSSRPDFLSRVHFGSNK